MIAEAPRTPVSTLYSASMDNELEQRLANFLYQRGVPGADCVRLDVYGGVVAVSGELPTRYAKWLCIECCRRVAGVIKIIDQMKVEPAISELPKAVHVAAEPKSRMQNRRQTSDYRGGWLFHHNRASEYATQETIAASQLPRLPAAA